MKRQEMKRENPPGTYILNIALSHSCSIRVGSLGSVAFEKGRYLYVGSALSGLRSRLQRHLRSEKRLHWHIDYLLQHGRIQEIWYHVGPERYECVWARALCGMLEAQPFRAPFGASDCDCPTHLFYSKDAPCLEAFQAILKEKTRMKKLEMSPSGTVHINL